MRYCASSFLKRFLKLYEKYFIGVLQELVMVTSQKLIKSNILSDLAKWLSVRLPTKCLWIRISLLSLKLQIWRLLQVRSFLTFRQTIECGFTLKVVRDMIITGTQTKQNLLFCLEVQSSGTDFGPRDTQKKILYQTKTGFPW